MNVALPAFDGVDVSKRMMKVPEKRRAALRRPGAVKPFSGARSAIGRYDQPKIGEGVAVYEHGIGEARMRREVRGKASST